MLLRVITAIAVLSASAAGMALAQSNPEPAPAECQSCTARHQSLQALQNARTKPDTEDCDSKPLAETADDPDITQKSDCIAPDPTSLVPPAPEG